MKITRLLGVASAALFYCSAALGQNAGTVTNHAFVIGKGVGQSGYTSLLCGSAQLAVGQSAADPICQTITGDVTIGAAGVTAIGATKVASAMLNADVFSTAHSWAGQQTFTAPILGAATATSINKVTVTQPATGSTLTIADGKTVTVNNSLTMAGTDATTQTFPPSSGAVLTSVSAAGGGLTGTYPNPTVASVPASALPNPTASTLGGVQSLAAVASKWINSISATGVPSATQPAFADISGSVAVAQMPALTGDITTAAGTVATAIGANKVTNAMRSQMAAYTLKGNATGALANEADIDVTALTAKPSPVSADIVLIQDSAAANAMKRTTVGALASAGSVASYNGRTGAVTATGTDVPLRGYLSGLTLSTAGGSTTFGIAAGVATNSTSTAMMALASAYTKTNVGWSVGSGVGCIDTGAVSGLTWYHVFLIQRPDTGVVDALCSLSATAPTLPASYTVFRRIGSMKTDGGGSWIKFTQDGDTFLWDAAANDVAGVTLSTTSTLYALAVPSGVVVYAKFNGSMFSSGASAGQILITSPNMATAVANTPSGNYNLITGATGQSYGGDFTIQTNTSAQIRAVASSAQSFYVNTYGWVDRRGRDL